MTPPPSGGPLHQHTARVGHRGRVRRRPGPGRTSRPTGEDERPGHRGPAGTVRRRPGCL